MDTQLLDITRTAELLAVHPRTVDRWYRSGHMPQPVRPGGKAIRWRLQDLQSWIADGCQSDQLGGFTESET